MRIYLDDDCASRLLIGQLRGAGHDVQSPADVGLSGQDDAVHLRQAVREQRVMVTRNYRDFLNLHDLVIDAQGHHPGIKDNDPKRDLKGSGIVRAIANLLAAGMATADQYIILNHWR